jgi:hypothetical protein
MNDKEIFEDEFEEEEEYKPTTYDLPKDVVEEVPVQGDDRKFSELSHYEKIKLAASQNGVDVLKPKSSCKHCLGRGYISIKNVSTPSLPTSSEYKTSSTPLSAIPTSAFEIITEELPNPCRCIFRKEDQHKMFTGNVTLGRKQYRKYKDKDFHKKKKKIDTSGANIEMQRLKKKQRDKKKAKKKMKKKYKR